mgnify:CR=1 FL=1|tara:strand:- start:123 stop:635 length:513 start_codon:yes stop_codon:yes gene_type:complete
METTKQTFVFWQKTYDDTVKLLNLSKEYFSTRGKQDRMMMPGSARLAYTLVMSNITIKLTSALSWLMVMRAIENGEIDIASVDEDKLHLNKLDEHVFDEERYYGYLPEIMAQISKESTKLYKRVERLEKTMWSNHQAGSDHAKIIEQSDNILAFAPIVHDNEIKSASAEG